MKSMLAVVAAAVTALFLSSCSSPASDGHADHQHGESSSAAAQPAGHNAADVTFVTGMIPHHEQAVAMSEMVAQRSTDPAVIALAADISAAQGPEIATMKALLGQWNAGDDPTREGHDMGAMHGMVDDTTMTRLESLSGAPFDHLFLQSMIGHHEGAIAMADTELADGANSDAKALASQIVSAQEAEIAQMKQMQGA
jgi:uncharacterized protein (DUF305 family)